MRLKNVKGAKERINNSTFVMDKNIFNKKKPLHIEIGMGKGKFITEKAIKNQDINFIGIEKFDSVLVRALDKIEGQEIHNLRLMRMDALNIEEYFNKEVDIIYLNFSDPWPKVRHADRRLTSPIFLEKYKKISKNNTHIIMKTDNRKLFEYSLEMFSLNNFEIKKISLDLHADDIKENITTEYEMKFSSKGGIIYMVEVIQRLDI
jgi:tRNA (guanine-N7-)-methyltransferase